MNLPPLPESVTADLAEARAFLESTDSAAVPDIFDSENWSLQATGHRALALIGRGIEQGGLAPEDSRLLDEMAAYMLAFQFDEEEDWLLPGAALALNGLLHSEPGSLDNRYRYGLARMWYPWEQDYPQRRPAETALAGYVLDAAISSSLPLLPATLEYYRITGRTPPARADTFSMALSDEQFMRGLSLPGDPGRRLGQALSSGDLELARQTVRQYYAAKMKNFDQGRVTLGESELEEARDLLDNIFILRAHMVRRHDFGDTVDWTTVLDDDIESNVSINSQPHLLLLAQAWRATGDIRFRDHLIRLLESWIEQSPRPDIGQWALQWRTLEVGSRAVWRWPQIMALASDDSVFVSRMYFPMLRLLHAHADYLMQHNMRHPNNWTQVESSGLLAASIILGEHEDSPLFRRTALRRFRFLNRELYFPDGLQVENSFYYHGFPLGTQKEVYSLARSMDVALDTSWTGVLERGIEALVLGALPNGNKPMVSDVGPYLSPVGPWQRTGRELFPGNPLFEFPVGVPEYPGPAPEVTSYHFPWAGYCIMRQDWSVDAQYMLFDNGFYGTNHQHEDKLNVIVYAWGRELLHDPGIYRYSRDGFERYFRGSRGHNLVLVDGKSQRRDLDYDKSEPFAGVSFPDEDSRWVVRDSYTIASGAYRKGFARKIHPLWYGGPRDDERESLVQVQHHRKILWVRGEYWVVFDYLAGAGEHTLEQVWHFSPLIESESAEGVLPGRVELTGNRAAVSRNPGVANIAVLQAGGDDLRARKQKGEKDPHAGWTCLYGENPAWDVTFEARRELPSNFVTVLYPMRPGEKEVPRLRTRRLDNEAVVLDIEFPAAGRTDRLLLARDPLGARMEHPGGSFTGEALLLRKTASGEFEEILREPGH